MVALEKNLEQKKFTYVNNFLCPNSQKKTSDKQKKKPK